MRTYMTLDEAKALINSGQVLFLAGEEALLRGLPKGKWLGGTIPYFMSEQGGCESKEMLQVFPLEEEFQFKSIGHYSADELGKISAVYPENGVSFIVLPAFTEVHWRYAEEIVSFPEAFNSPLVGWVAGIHLNDVGKSTPKVVDGLTGEVSQDMAMVMHLELPKERYAKIDILNMFEQGTGDTLTFTEKGITAKTVLVNGEPRAFTTYIKETGLDTRLPLVADYFGAMVNVSFRGMDEESGEVSFYAPVFPGVEYRVAKPFGDYAEMFRSQTRLKDVQPAFSCNCLLNYIYGELQGKKTGSIVGPMTYGEIAYMLLNQTLVYVTIESKEA